MTPPEMEYWQRDVQEEAKGRDAPRGLPNAWGDTLLLLTERQKHDRPREDESVERVQALDGFRFKYDYYSQNPVLFVIDGEWRFHIMGNNFATRNEIPDNNGQDSVFDKITFGSDELGVKKIQEKFNPLFARDTKGNEPFPAEIAKRVQDYGANTDSTQAGLDCISFMLKGRVRVEYVGTDKGAKMPDDVASLLRFSRTRPRITLVRKPKYARRDADSLWMHRVRMTSKKGLMPFYTQLADNVVGQKFKQWIETPDTRLPHQPWMGITNERNRVTSYASHFARKRFGSMEEWEITMAVFLIHETQYTRKCMRRYYSFDHTHTASVKYNHNGRVELEVSMIKHESWAVPSINGRDKFKIQARQKPEDDEEVRWDGVTFFGRAIPVETDKSFVLGINLDTPESQHHIFGENNTELEIRLEMGINDVPSKRQLQAIELIADMGDEAKDNIFIKSFRQFLLGEAVEFEESQQCLKVQVYPTLEERWKKTFDNFVKASEMNNRQRQAWDSIFGSRNLINLVQGHPRTGKTQLDTITALCFAQLGVKTVIAAPTNKACEGIMKSLMEKVSLLCDIDPSIASKFKIIYFPTTATLKRDLANQVGMTEQDVMDLARDMVWENEETRKPAGEDDEVEMADTPADTRAPPARETPAASTPNPEEDPIKSYRLWSHIEEEIHDQLTHGANQKDMEDAKYWESCLRKIRRGDAVPLKALKKFNKMAVEVAARVVTKEDVMIVVTTWNNSALLRDYGFKPEALIIDEANSGSEADVCVPLALGAKHLILTADPWQSMPMVRSRWQNEYEEQGCLSLFERTWDLRGVPRFSLRVSY
jgi:hypothetical protein